MTNNKILTIIIPVYNVAPYLMKCFRSLAVSKHFSRFEVILVDDGSTDGSKQICDRISSDYDGVRVIHKKNEGLSEARNVGINESVCDYIMFVDSDDMVYTKQLDSVINKIGLYDIILFDWDLIDEKDKTKKKIRHNGLEEGLFESSQIIKNQLKCMKYYRTTAWQGIYKKEIIIHHSLFFIKGIYHEDDLWFPQILLHSFKVYNSGLVVYGYRDRIGSISNDLHKNDAKHVEDIIYACNELYHIIDQCMDSPILRREMKKDITRRCIHGMIQYEGYKYRDRMNKLNKDIAYRNTYFIDWFRIRFLFKNPQLLGLVTDLFKKKDWYD